MTRSRFATWLFGRKRQKKEAARKRRQKSSRFRPVVEQLNALIMPGSLFISSNFYGNGWIRDTAFTAAFDLSDTLSGRKSADLSQAGRIGNPFHDLAAIQPIAAALPHSNDKTENSTNHGQPRAPSAEAESLTAAFLPPVDFHHTPLDVNLFIALTDPLATDLFGNRPPSKGGSGDAGSGGGGGGGSGGSVGGFAPSASGIADTGATALPIQANSGIPFAPVSGPPKSLPASPLTINAVHHFGQPGQGRLYVSGSLRSTADLGSVIDLDFYSRNPAAGKEVTVIGSKSIRQVEPDAVNFSVVLTTEAISGTQVAVALHNPQSEIRNPQLEVSDWVAIPNEAVDRTGIPAALQGLAPRKPSGHSGHGLLDAQQPYTVNVPSTTGEFVTLQSAYPLANVDVYDPPSQGHLPLGLIGFEISGVPAGGSATVTMIYPDYFLPNSYDKYDFTTGELTPFDYDGATGAEISGNIVTLNYLDGARGDQNSLADGVIDDPGGGDGPYPPTANNDSYSVNHDHQLTVNAPGVLANDTDPNGFSLTDVLVSSTTRGTVTLNSTGGFTYTPTAAGYTGPDKFTYKAYNGHLYSTVATVTITLTDTAPVANNDSYSVSHDHTLTVTTSNSVLNNDTDAENDPLTAVLVSNPTHGTLQTFNNNNGTLTYLPNNHYIGDDTFQYKAKDNALQQSSAATVTIHVTNAAPAAANDGTYSVIHDRTLTVNAASGVLANDSDADGDSFTAAIVANASHGTVTLATDGSFTYVPAALYTGSDSFTYRDTDTFTWGNTATVNLTVTNVAPVSHDDSYTVLHDQTLTVNAAGVLGNDTDADSDTLHAILVSGAAHGTLTLNDNGSFTYVPSAGFTGTDTFTYKASDNVATSSNATVTIAVSDHDPVATNDSYTAISDNVLTIAAAAGVLANDTDQDNDPLTAQVVSGPTHGALNFNADGSFSYTPQNGYEGPDSFTYHVFDRARYSNTAMVSITVNWVAPVAVDDGYSVGSNNVLSILLPGLINNDSDPEHQPLAATVLSQPNHGRLTSWTDGSFIYEPNRDYVGGDSFTYKVNDGRKDSNTATVTLGVGDQPPVAAGDAYTLLWNTTLNVPPAGVLANDHDPEGQALQATLVAGPSHAADFQFNSDGSFSYKPNADYTGPDSFTYKANDGTLSGNTATVNLTVTNSVAWIDNFVSGTSDHSPLSSSGSVTADGRQRTLHEGNSFLVTLSRPFVVPANPSFLAFSYSNLNFDTTATRSIHDAFEASLVDGTGRTLVYPFASQRDAYFNITEPWVSALAGSAALGRGVTFMDRTFVGSSTIADRIVLVDISRLAPGSNATVIFRLVNNDSDTNSSVQIGTHEPLITGAASVNEASTYTLNLSARGPAADRVHGWTIHWGDGSQSTENGGQTTAQHVYADGGNNYTITATDTDDDGIWNSDPLSITVNNVPPTVTSASNLSGNEGQSLNFSAGFSDVGTLDTHTAVIDWGDGSTSSGSVSETGGSGTVTGSHTYADNGTYTITVTVTDKDGGSGGRTATATIANVAPTVNGTDQNVVQNTPFSADIATFTDPGFTNSQAGTTESFTATIDWGDNTSASTGVVTIVNGSAGVLTTGTVRGSHTYTASGDYTAHVTVSDDDGGSMQASFTVHVAAYQATKFYVVDQSAHAFFYYNSAGALISQSDLAHFNSRPRGVASNSTGTITWVVDSNRVVYVYSTADGSLLGSWQANGPTQPQDITTDGTDMWIVDDASHTVYRYAGAASRLSGSQDASSSFLLDSNDPNPTGLVTDGTSIWVADQHASTNNNLFVYSVTGTLLGSWQLDLANISPTGITLSPASGSQDLWVVDQSTSRVYRYASGRTLLSGSHSAADYFDLAAGDHHPEGIADPPVLAENGELSAQSQIVAAGSAYLISGNAQPDATTHSPVTGVTVNGHQATVDVAGNFFDQQTIALGDNTFTITATDAAHTSTSQSVTITGLDDSSSLSSVLRPLSSFGCAYLSDVSGSMTPIYGRTSFNQNTNILYAGLQLQNSGSYAVDAPLLLAVTHISAPSVRVYQPDGSIPENRGQRTEDSLTGLPYFDLSPYVPGSTLAPGQTTIPSVNPQFSSLRFYNPERVPFTYQLVVLGHLNKSPRFISVPVIQVPAGKPYSYQATAIDPESDPITYSIVGGPVGMSINPNTGVLSWTPTTPGNYAVTLRISDPSSVLRPPSSSSLQSFVLSVTASQPNRPPRFTSTPVVDAYVNTPYVYQATATDPDQDPLAFSVSSVSSVVQGFAIGVASGLVTWTPTDAQLGYQDVTLQVADGHGGTDTQPYRIWVHKEPGNHDPIIISTPPATYNLPGANDPPSGNVSPQRIQLVMTQGQVSNQTVSITMPGSGGGGGGIGNFQDVGQFHIGDLFLSGRGYDSATQTMHDEIRHYNSQLQFQGVLPTTELPSFPTGMAFDSHGALYVASYSGNAVTKIDAVTGVASSFGSGANFPGFHYPESILFDAGGNVYVSNAGPEGGPVSISTGGIEVFDPSGAYQQTLLAGQRIDWMDLEVDNRTVLFTQEGTAIRTYDLQTGTTGTFATTPATNGSGENLEAFGVQILPDGGVLLADGGDIRQFNPQGQLVQTYDVADSAGQDPTDWRSLSLSPDGTTFWAGQISSPGSPQSAYQFQLGSSGGPLHQIGWPVSSHLIAGQLGGVVVYGSPMAATQPINVIATDASGGFTNLTGTIPGVGAGQTATFNVRFTNDGLAHGYDLLFVRGQTGVVLGSIPVTITGGDYQYHVVAEDADGDPLTFTLTSAPAGATLNVVRGSPDPAPGEAVIDWFPPQAGSYSFEVQVSDGRGGRAKQDFTVVVTAGQANHAPVLPQLANATAIAGDPFQYQTHATDADGDRLIYYLVAPIPSGMSIDSDTGLIQWTPSVAVTVPVTVQVRDVRGGLSAAQSFAITVSPHTFDNHDPQFTSTHIDTATSGQLYYYVATATDDDADPLTYDLPVHPDGMTVDPVRGVVVWRPTDAQANQKYWVLLRVQDGRGGVGLQWYQIDVAHANHPPLLTSDIFGYAIAGVAWRFQLRAVDQDGDTLSYIGDALAQGVALDQATGVFTWDNPIAVQNTDTIYHMPFHVSDGRGGATGADFILIVLAQPGNGSPTITSTPRATAQFNLPYFYQVVATDPNHQQLAYSLLPAAGTTNPPAGVSIDPYTGLMQWTPTVAQLGPQAFVVHVSDGLGGFADQTVNVTVVSQATNQPPSIRSTPIDSATVSDEYVYYARGSDPDGDPLAWSLATKPDGMVIDPGTGVVVWTPTEAQLGDQAVTVRVIDAFGSPATQSFTVTVRGVNRPPQIRSGAPTDAVVGIAYSYPVVALDADGDPLTYSLVSVPSASGLSIDSHTGLVSWLSPVQGAYSLTISVSDGRGGFAQQPYDLTVWPVHARNFPPVINPPDPPQEILAGVPVSFHVNASDVDGDVLHYTLTSTPSATGLGIDYNTGVVTWSNPTVGPNGVAYTVTITVTDAGNLWANETFSLLVRTNNPPQMLAIADQTITGGRLFGYQVQAGDPDGDPITYSISSAPDLTGRLSVTPQGGIQWSPQIGDRGSYAVTVTATDPFGAFVSRSFTLHVTGDTTPPSVQLLIDPNPGPVNLGSQVTLLVLASDDVRVATKSLTVNGVNYALDSAGRAVVTMNAVGTFAVVASATDSSGNVGTAPGSIQVVDPNDLHPPTVTIISPAPSQGHDPVITVPTNVTGSISDTVGITSWTVKVASFDGTPPRIIASGSSAITGTFAQFDPTVLANGSYTIVVSGINNGGHSATASVRVQVEGHLKLGRETFSVTDLRIPVAGIPITVTRTYDSLESGKVGDFGYGWHIGFGDAQLAVDLVDPNLEGYGAYPPFLDGTRVYITMPDGQRQGFTFHPYEEIGYFGLQDYWHPYFVPDPSNVLTLTVPDVTLTKDGSTGWYYTYGGTEGIITYNPADFNFGAEYTVKQLNGTSYTVDATTGKLIGAADRNGNTLSFGDDGISSNTGRAVVFHRDPQDRIIGITDPRGNSVLYSYDANGDLVSVTDRVGNKTQYGYDSNHPHYLQTMTNALGIQILSVSYDASGRVSAVTDAAGQQVHMGYDTNALNQTLTDPNGANTTLSFDSAGNIVETVDQTGRITLMSYDRDANSNLTHFLHTETQVIGQIDSPQSGQNNDLTTTYVNDSFGTVQQVIDSLGNITRYTHNAFGQTVTSSNEIGETTTCVYDNATGNLVLRTDSLGQSEAIGYSDAGQVTSITTGLGAGDTIADRATETFSYDSYGDLLSTTDASSVTHISTVDANGNKTGASFVWINPADSSDQHTVTDTSVINGNDQETQMITSEGGTTTDYDDLSRPFQMRDIYGRLAQTTYDVRGLAIETRQQSPDANGVLHWMIHRTVYDAKGQPIVETGTYPETATTPIEGTQNVYDDAGRVIETDRLCGVIIDIVTTNGIPSSVLTSLGTIVSRQTSIYDDVGRVATSINENGLETINTYNRLGQLVETRTQSVDQTGAMVWLVERTLYDRYGRTSISTDEYVEGSSVPIMGTRTLYDTHGRANQTDRLQGVMLSLINGDTVLTTAGTVVYSTYTIFNGQERVQELIAADGEITDHEYDNQGRQTAEIRSPVTDSIAGQVLRLRMETVYDDYGNVHIEKTNIRQHMDGTIDRSLERDTVSDQDQFGNIVKTSYPDGSFTASTYNAHHQKVSEQDLAGHVTQYHYSQERLTEIDLPAVPDPFNGNTLTQPRFQYGYDQQGNEAQITSPLGHQTQFTFDAQGRELTHTLPMGQNEQFSYDSRGRDILHISFEGVVMLMVYDAADRLSAKKFYPNVATYNNGTGTPSETITYVYDAFGRLLSETSSVTGVTIHEYDPQGRTVQIGSPQGVVNYEYDNLGRETRAYTGTAVSPIDDVRRGYDSLGKLATVTVWEQDGVLTPSDSRPTTSYQYDLLGNLHRVHLANGVVSDYQYDLLGRLSSLTHYLPDNSKLAEYNYVRSANGQLDHVTETRWDTGVPKVTTTQWTYNADARLTKEVIVSADPGVSQTEQFTYDLAGNRLSFTKDVSNDGTMDATATYSYDANDRLLSEIDTAAGSPNAIASYVYGGAGNPATILTGKTTADGAGNLIQQVSYGYDQHGSLALAVTSHYSAGGLIRRETTNLVYNQSGIRTSAADVVETTTSPGSPLTVQSNTTTTYLNDPESLMGNSQVIAEIIHDNGTGQDTKRIATVFGLDAFVQNSFIPGGPTGGVMRVLVPDGHGSTRLLMDGSAHVLENYWYDAFGNALGFDPSTALTDLLFSGEQWDDRIGAQYLRARYYDPRAGRFSASDPYSGNLQDPFSLNRYLYTKDDPVNGIDPSGMDEVTAFASVVAMTGGFLATGAPAVWNATATLLPPWKINIDSGPEFIGRFGNFGWGVNFNISPVPRLQGTLVQYLTVKTDITKKDGTKLEILKHNPMRYLENWYVSGTSRTTGKAHPEAKPDGPFPLPIGVKNFQDLYQTFWIDVPATERNTRKNDWFEIADQRLLDTLRGEITFEGVLTYYYGMDRDRDLNSQTRWRLGPGAEIFNQNTIAWSLPSLWERDGAFFDVNEYLATWVLRSRSVRHSITVRWDGGPKTDIVKIEPKS